VSTIFRAFTDPRKAWLFVGSGRGGDCAATVDHGRAADTLNMLARLLTRQAVRDLTARRSGDDDGA
jgi:hypothetical protein